MKRHDRYRYIARRLDRIGPMPTGTLAFKVMRGGACIEAMTSGDPPELRGTAEPDRELAEQICARCPVQEECLELELRWSGPFTVGVFGALPEQERRALYPYWRARRVLGGDQ